MDLSALQETLFAQRKAIEKKFIEEMAALDEKERIARELLPQLAKQVAARTKTVNQIQDELNAQYAKFKAANNARLARDKANWNRNPVVPQRKRAVAELKALGIEQPHLQPGAAMMRAERPSAAATNIVTKENRKSRRRRSLRRKTRKASK